MLQFFTKLVVGLIQNNPTLASLLSTCLRPVGTNKPHPDLNHVFHDFINTFTFLFDNFLFCNFTFAL